jgi:ATP-dependent Lhr-like helicase
VSTFSRFAPRLQEEIATRLGWTTLRPVQEEAGAALLDGENAIVLAPTAGGKTEAAMFPTLSRLLENPTSSVGALYLAPIKALLNNQADRLGTYTEMVGLDRFVWHGDTKPGDKRKFIKEPCELLMTTPESLEVMLVSSRVPTPKLFADLRIVVVDEVHALAGTDRGAHFMSVLERIARLSQHDVQRVGLSATVGNPAAILAWLQGTSKRPGRIVDPPKPKAKRQLSVRLEPSLLEIASEAALLAQGKKSLFFCQSRAMTERVAERMRARGTEVFVHHSSVAQQERAEAERNFHEGSNACIACTSTLELGIDVGDLDLVFQANAPSTVSSFLQRMGRTGRRSNTVANTTFFGENFEVPLQAAAPVELANGGWVEAVPVQTRCWPVLVHQRLALTLQFGGATREAIWEQLSTVSDFRGIRRDEFDRVVEHMLIERYLFESSGQLSMGETAEKVYGRKNFMELYAVLSSPVLYRVVAPQKAEIGSLEQAFVDSLVERIVRLSAWRPCVAGRTRQSGRANRAGHSRATRQATELGRLHPADARLRPVSEDACLTRKRRCPRILPSASRRGIAGAPRRPRRVATTGRASHPHGWRQSTLLDLRGRPYQPHPEVHPDSARRLQGHRRQLSAPHRRRQRHASSHPRHHRTHASAFILDRSRRMGTYLRCATGISFE